MQLGWRQEWRSTQLMKVIFIVVCQWNGRLTQPLRWADHQQVGWATWVECDLKILADLVEWDFKILTDLIISLCMSGILWRPIMYVFIPDKFQVSNDNHDSDGNDADNWTIGHVWHHVCLHCRVYAHEQLVVEGGVPYECWLGSERENGWRLNFTEDLCGFLFHLGKLMNKINKLSSAEDRLKKYEKLFINFYIELIWLWHDV